MAANDPTTDPDLTSFLPTAATSPFPIQNLPYGVFRPAGQPPRVGVAIADQVLDLAALERRGLLQLDAAPGERPFGRPSLNHFMSLGPEAWQEARSTISHLLQADVTTLRDDAELRTAALHPQGRVEMVVPVEVGDYTDFYSSKEHATNVGTLLRGPEKALMPNWLQMPIAYHGRASSIAISGTPVHRPQGQRSPLRGDTPEFGPTRALDFELEMGFLIGTGNPLHEPITTAQALDHVFGMVIVNDWSARDVQKWEYQPLGPFLSKSFLTSISPWVVPMAALAPFAVDGPEQSPPPLPYLKMESNPSFDIQLQVQLQTSQMDKPQTISESNLRHLYWNVCQQIAHHTVGGCNLRTGDLLATGTISGPTPDSLGCLLELSHGGRKPLELTSGESRTFLQDGDRLTLTGWCQGASYRVGFGAVTGEVRSR